ncbi:MULTISPECIES: hypothetical protein [Bacillales]|uniref:Uncharacterized protein n=1 Tax=Ureibacillus massiliensis 4400831 = CIP 108448 = CCUG 49529 TaxID=1211035 RepID=A0A0A3JS77_9BACL|nr:MULTISPECIES: hypothetical protein [Bacillales]KGR89842.1 hypothetical protein CD30_14705 [Ureibacillus massiliensis 4400831 = CIP 108448 = CCUG 49529]
MGEQIIYDMTTLQDTIGSMSKLLGVDERQITKYCVSHKDDYDVEGFFSLLGLSEYSLLDFEIYITSLHVTTDKDNCSSVKKYGLLNLQQALIKDTPLRAYLEGFGVFIEIDKKQIKYHDKVFDISKEYNGINKPVDWIIYKLYRDFQLNSFFYSDNVLKYGGGIRRRPEFLYNLADFLGEPNIEYDWIKGTNCYVIKYKTAISQLADWTFDIDKDKIDYLDETEINIHKIKWFLNQSLRRINNEIFYNSIDDCYSYLKNDVFVPVSDILRVYSENEYLEEYRIRE